MEEVLANYESSFFIMYVPTDADLEIRNMSEADFAIFFHEYIHFIQDITSIYGYSSIFSHGEYMRKVINDIYKGPKQFQVPIEVKDDSDYVWLNKKITEYSLGDKDDVSYVDIKDIFVEKFMVNDTFSIPELHIRAITGNDTEEIVVGAYAIRENMAYLLEKRCTTKYMRSSEFQYQIVEILTNKMCPEKLNDECLIALCDVALQCSVPGYGLYQYLEAISNGKLEIKRPEDIYNHFFSKTVHFMGHAQSTSQALISAAKMAMDHLLSYVKIESLSEEFQQWIIYTLTAGMALRILRPYFFLEMVRSGLDKKNSVLQFMAKNIGSPQMINAKGNRFQLATSRPICRFEYLEAVREIERLFEYGIRSCSLKQWCEMSPDGAPVDERCDNTPWERCNDANLCPYGMLWRHWNLADRVVKI